MKMMRHILSIVILFLLSAPVWGQATKAFIHTADAGNISSNWTTIEHPDLNGNPSGIVLTTQNWNPPGSSGVYNDNHTGVWYDGAQWAVFHQDWLVDMTEGAAFNVWVPGTETTAFVHLATADNISLNWTYLDHPSLNNNPNAIFFVDQNWNPPGSSGVYNDNAIGIWYDGFAGQWGVFNQDPNVVMAEGAAFNVMIPHDDMEAFVHTATVDDIVANYTYLDHPLLNGNPDANILVTQNWNPPGQGGVYNNQSIGVWYDGSQWAIFNQDWLVDMVEGASFNILVYEELSSSATEPIAAGVFKVENAFPNPFDNQVGIDIQLQEKAELRADIFDARGNWVANLAQGEFAPGGHRLTWNGSGAPAGLYFCQFQIGDSVLTQKLSLLR